MSHGCSSYWGLTVYVKNSTLITYLILFLYVSQLAKLRSEMEQQRLELQKTHSTEMEHVLGKVSTINKDKWGEITLSESITTESRFFPPRITSHIQGNKFTSVGELSAFSRVQLFKVLRVISLTVLANSIHNILIFFAEKMWVAYALQKLLTVFSAKNFSIFVYHSM